MTFAQICQQHCASIDLKFTHPDLHHYFMFDGAGQLFYIDDFGNHLDKPLWLSDFDRDDWHIISGG